MTGYHLVLDTKVEQFQDLVGSFALEDEQVLDHELVLSVPAYPKAVFAGFLAA